jgi:hypothetical protein
MSHTAKCPNCGHEFNCQGQRFKHNLTRGLVITLIKLAREAKRNGLAPVKVKWNGGVLKGSELGNYTKLRYFRGLIAKREDRDQGEWIITRQGFAFLRGEYEVPKYVYTQDAKCIEESEEVVTIKNFERDLYQGERWQIDFLEELRNERHQKVDVNKQPAFI